MGSASVCSRRTVRAAAGLGDCSAGICNSTSRPDTSSRDQHDRGFSSSCSASASGSGTSSDEELEGFNDYRRAAGQAGSPSGSDDGSPSRIPLSLAPVMYGYGSSGLTGVGASPTGSPFYSSSPVAGSPDARFTRLGDRLPSGTPTALSRQTSIQLAEKCDSVLHLDTHEAEDIYISPDVPLIYVSCISTVTLLYFILFVDCKALARMIFPLAVDELHWHSLEKLETGLNVGASILLAFFVWLLHALLFDIAGMLAGLLPSAITFSSVFSYRIMHQSSGLLVAALVAVACGFAASRSLETQLRARRRFEKLNSEFNR